MANHGKTGAALEEYRRRKLRPHIVSGVYVIDVGSKPIAMNRDQVRRKLRSGIRYKRFRCKGRGVETKPTEVKP